MIMNIDVEIYMKNFISFFEKNPNDLMELIGVDFKDNFFNEVKKQCYINVENNGDPTLTQQQLIEIVVNLKKTNPKDVLKTGVFQSTNFGLISLN